MRPVSVETGARILSGRRRLLAQRRLRGSKARNRHPKRRARYVIKSDLVTEHDRCGIAAMLTANAELDVRPRFTAASGGNAHKLADAVPIDRHKRIGRQNALSGVNAQEARGIVAADAQSGLGEIICAE